MEKRPFGSLDANGFVNRRSRVQSAPPAPETQKSNRRAGSEALLALAVEARRMAARHLVLAVSL